MEEERLRIRVNTSTASAERDLGKLEAKADAAARDRTINIDIDTKSFNESINSLERSLTRMSKQGGASKSMDRFASSSLKARRNAKGLSLVMTSLKFPLVAAGGNAAASGVSALAVGFTGLTAALGPAVGLLGVVPGLFGAIGQGAGALVGAFSGVGDVFKALDSMESAKSASTEYGGAVDQLRQQERSLALAQREAMDAQDNLSRARVLAARDIEDAELSLEQSYLSERRAVRSLEEAQKRLARGRKTTSDATKEHLQFTDDFTGKVFDAVRIKGAEVDTDYSEADAILDVEQAELDLREARLSRARQEQDMVDLQRKGIEGHDLMVDATRRLADAQYGLQEASAIAAAGITDLTKAQDELDKAMEDVHPSVQHFAEYIKGDVKDAFIGLRKEMQGEIFPGLHLAVAGAMTNFDLLEDGMGETARIMGGMFEEIADWTTSPEFREDFQSVLSINNDLLGDLADVALDVMEGFMELIITSEPLLDWFGDLLTRSSALFERWAEDDTGELASFFDRTIVVADSLFTSLGNVYGTLKNIGAAAEPLATWILQSLQDVTTEQEKWTASAEGQEKMAGYFERMKDPLSEIAGLTSDIAKGLFEIGSPEQLADLLSLIREDLVPSLIGFFDVVDDGFGPAVIEAVSDFVDLFTTLVDDGGGGLTTFVETLGDMAEVLKWFLDHIPGLDKVVSTLLMLKGVQLAFNVTGLSRMMGAVSGAGAAAGGLTGIFKSTSREIEVEMARAASAGQGFATTMGDVAGATGRGAKKMSSQIRGAFKGPTGILAMAALGVTAFKMWGDMMDEAKRKGEEFARGRYAPATDALANSANQAGSYETALGLRDQALADVGVAEREQVGFGDAVSRGNAGGGVLGAIGAAGSWILDIDMRTEIEAIGNAASTTAGQLNPLITNADTLAYTFGVGKEKAYDYVQAQADMDIAFSSGADAVAAYARELESLIDNELQEAYDKTTSLFDATLEYELRSMDTEDQLGEYRIKELELAKALFDGTMTTEEAAEATRDFERDTLRMAQQLNDQADAAVNTARKNAELEGSELTAKEATRIHRDELGRLTSDLDPNSALMQHIGGLMRELQRIEETNLDKTMKVQMDLTDYLKNLRTLRNNRTLTIESALALDADIATVQKAINDMNGITNDRARRIGGVTYFADGGRYSAGQTLIGGEGGPELQVPDSGGYIMNNNDTAALLAGLKQFLEGGSGGRPINIEQHFYEKVDSAAVGRETAWAVE